MLAIDREARASVAAWLELQERSGLCAVRKPGIFGVELGSARLRCGVSSQEMTCKEDLSEPGLSLMHGDL